MHHFLCFSEDESVCLLCIKLIQFIRRPDVGAVAELQSGYFGKQRYHEKCFSCALQHIQYIKQTEVPAAASEQH